jgi:hypothetical protein
MTPDEFVDATRFPLTTWRGMHAWDQALNDFCSLETLRGERARWNQLTKDQRARLAELETKAALWPAVRAQLTG